MPDPIVEAAPAAASVPAIAAILESTPEPAAKIVKAPAVVKSCPCGDQCTCGCQDGQPCRCGEANPKLASAPPPKVVTTSGREWVRDGQPWTRARLLNHLYHDGNHGQHAPGSLDHLPMETLQAMHNGEHEQRVAAPAIPRAAPRMIVSSGGCPNGQCPPQRRFR